MKTMISEILKDAVKISAAMLWFMLGGACALSPFLLMADDKTLAIILLCFTPIWVAATKRILDEYKQIKP